MNGEIAEVDLALEVVERPARVRDAALMTRVRPDRRVPSIHRRDRRVLDVPHEPAASAHEELAVPLVGEQQRELDLRADDAVHAAVRSANLSGGGRSIDKK